MTPGLRRLYAPRRVKVETDSDGSLRAIEGIAVEAVREEWWVEDRWWTLRPLRRHYFELVLVDGRDVAVFRSGRDRWYRQQA
jgi:hypothetical protein